MIDYAATAAAGAAFLDENGPADWRDRVDPLTLNLESSNECVLGQVYSVFGGGGFWHARNKFSWNDHDTVALGFDVSSADLNEFHRSVDEAGDTDAPYPYTVLADEWSKIIG